MNHVFTYLFQPERKGYSLLKSALGLLLFIFFLPAVAQKAPSNFVTTKVGVTPLSYNINGYGPNSGGNYFTDVEFNVNFGKENAASNGFNREISSFQVDGRTYVRGEQGNTPFTKVVLKRIDNSVTGNKATAFFEVAEDPADAALYLAPDYVNDVEGLMNSYVFNRGSDNTLSNNGQTHNNVERIDLIFENGIKAPSNASMLNRSGILIMERGGNDSFKFALIKTLSGGGDKQVVSLGDLKTADKMTAWGGTEVSFKSVVFQRNGDEGGNLKPSQLISTQEVFGTFISLQDLGVGADEMFYGISLFANDVTSVGDGQNLVDLSAGFPTDTDGTSDGGLDFMAGGGFFMLANNVGGRVFHDAAPDPSSINSHTGGQDGSLINGLNLYVSLTDMSGNILATVPVENGGYTFYDIEDGEYKVVLHSAPGGASVSDLPDGWYGTGEGANGTKDGEVNGTITLTVPAASGGNLIMNNFGINSGIVAEDDDFGSRTSVVAYTTPETVFVNDVLNNAPVNPAQVILKVADTEVTAAVALKDSVTGADVPGVKLNPDGTVTVDAGTPSGTYTLTYTLCDRAVPANCDDAVILIRVEDATRIDADDDDFGTITSTVAYTTPEAVFANDSLNNAPVDPSLITFKVENTEVTTAVALKDSVTGADVPGVRLNPDGTVTVDAGTLPGTYTLPYTICEQANPANCDDAVILIRVKEEAPINADDDDFGTITSTVAYTTPEAVFANDSLNNAPVDPSLITFKVENTEVTTAVALKDSVTGADVPGVRLNPDGTVTVDAGTLPGTYTLPYTICEQANPANCDDAVILIRVKDATRIDADDDDFGTITSTVAYTTPGAVFANDSLNNAPVDPSLIIFKVENTEVTTAVALKDSVTGADVPGVRLNPDGTVTVDAGTLPGTYTLPYTICEQANPANCDNAVILIRVKEEAPINADDDDFGTITSTVAYTTPEAVFANDSLNNVPVDPSLITFKVENTEVTTAVALKDSVTGVDVPGVRLNPDGTVTVDEGTPSGTYTLPYTICEQANPANCDDAVIVIRVGVFDLALRKTVKAGQKAVFKEGDEVIFVITVKNEGTVDATDVEVVDYVPEGLELVGSDWVITDGKAKLAAPVASLPAGQEISLEITFKISSDAKPSVRNAAEISGAKGGTDIDSVFDEDRNNDEENEDDFDTSLITVCKKGGNCLPVKTTRIR